ncbi:ectoine hydroxylase [Salsuginibacillus halophilus]|uniref:Ectoine hydroxylase n=1 Tax=Salsuginibacillus halophilus TaxID=517424 RepID=A0A2P8HXK1_9BACI|nr:ectoine hydroxylase [Salsuginibacillus halophilus]PSL50885.1 ectoine hydroxylase [Salsuginibacillus halophilus]
MNQDRYPSRTGEEASILERKDPVIHEGSGDLKGWMDPNDVSFYEQNGYLLKKDLFSAEEIRLMVEKLNDELKRHETIDDETVIKEPESNEVRSIFDVHENSSFFKQLASDERIANIAREILGSDIYVHQSRINFKPGFKGKEFYWHSDFETWHVEDGMPDMRALSCSIILTDNHEYNGPLMLIPGSHKWYVSCPGETPEANYKSSLQKQEAGVPDHESMTWLAEQAGHQIDRATGPAGSVLFFDCNIMHGSAGNISPYARSNAFFVFNSVENRLEDPYSGQPPRPNYLANRSRSDVITPAHSPFAAQGASV